MAPLSPELKNIHAIVAMERESRERRSTIDRLTDTVSDVASSPIFIFGHVFWFAGWIVYNTLHSVPFDPFPFSLLTLIVSLEAIVLTGFVLMAQARMTRQADKRAHLDLQINLLAEQELTAILQLQRLLAKRAGIDLADVDPKLDQLANKTDVSRLAAEIGTELVGEKDKVKSRSAG
jgi:uncharacterized membrane protein